MRVTAAAGPVRRAVPAPVRRSGEQCGPGNGRKTPGGGDKVSHKGWPAITGILWMVLDSTPEGRPGDWYPKLDY